MPRLDPRVELLDAVEHAARSRDDTSARSSRPWRRSDVEDRVLAADALDVDVQLEVGEARLAQVVERLVERRAVAQQRVERAVGEDEVAAARRARRTRSCRRRCRRRRRRRPACYRGRRPLRLHARLASQAARSSAASLAFRAGTFCTPHGAQIMPLFPCNRPRYARPDSSGQAAQAALLGARDQLVVARARAALERQRHDRARQPVAADERLVGGLVRGRPGMPYRRAHARAAATRSPPG